MAGKTIVMLNLSETSRDPRVRRVGETLARLGHRVFAINPDTEQKTATDRHGSVEIRRVAAPTRHDLPRLAELARYAPEAAHIAHRASVEVMEKHIGRTYYYHRRWHARGRRALERAEGALHLDLAPARTLWSKLAPTPQDEIPRIRHMLMVNLELARRAIAERPDVIHANDLDTLLAGLIVKQKLQIPLVYDAHEIYPEQFPVAERTPLWHAFYTRLEEQLIHRADAHMTVCDSLGEYFQKRYGAPAFVTVRNTPSLRLLPPEPTRRDSAAPVEFLYHGALFKHRGLENLVEAAQHLRSGRIVLRGMGAHTDALKAQVERLGVGDRARVVPPVAVDELVARATESDVGLNPFPSLCLNTECALPNKFFEYMMAGLAIVSSDLIELRRLTNELGVGALLPSLAPTDIAAVLEDVARDRDRLFEQRRTAYRHARETFHWEREEERLVGLYARLPA
jgi:glycogen(starch) synthase